MSVPVRCAYPPLNASRSVREDVASKIASMRARFPRFTPQLAIVQAGTRPDSVVYVRMKSKAAQEVGIAFKHVTLPEEATTEEVVDVVQRLNADEGVSGILVQLPLGPHVGASGERTVTEAISPEKDVDGYVICAYCSVLTNDAQVPRIQHRSPFLARFQPSLCPVHALCCHTPPREHRCRDSRHQCGRTRT